MVTLGMAGTKVCPATEQSTQRQCNGDPAESTGPPPARDPTGRRWDVVAWPLGPTLGNSPSSCSSSAQSLLSLGMKALTPRTCSPSIPPSLPSSISPLVARGPCPPAASQFGESQRRDPVSPGAFRRRIGTRRAPWQNPHRGMPAASCCILYPPLYVVLRMGAGPADGCCGLAGGIRACRRPVALLRPKHKKQINWARPRLPQIWARQGDYAEFPG